MKLGIVYHMPFWQTADGELHEIKSPLILQPGPAALTDGLDAIHRVVREWSERQAAGALRQVGA